LTVPSTAVSCTRLAGRLADRPERYGDAIEPGGDRPSGSLFEGVLDRCHVLPRPVHTSGHPLQVTTDDVGRRHRPIVCTARVS
jgi:hypothetical protein